MNKKHNPLDVMSNMCKTCPFRVGNNELINKITHRVLNESNHICHTDNIKICRGSRNLQLQVFYDIGILSAPTDNAYNQTLKQFDQ
jgi:hypothetical protein